MENYTEININELSKYQHGKKIKKNSDFKKQVEKCSVEALL